MKAGGVSISAMPKVVGPGGQAVIIAELRDANGSPVPGEELYFDIYENNTMSSLSAIQATTDTNGRATVTYTAGIVGAPSCSACCRGDRIRATLFGSRTADFKVGALTPRGPVLINPTTTLVIGKAEEGEQIFGGGVEDLMQLVIDNIEPESWEGGGFSIQPSGEDKLVVNHTPEIQAEIEGLVREKSRA